MKGILFKEYRVVYNKYQKLFKIQIKIRYASKWKHIFYWFFNGDMRASDKYNDWMLLNTGQHSQNISVSSFSNYKEAKDMIGQIIKEFNERNELDYWYEIKEPL